MEFWQLRSMGGHLVWQRGAEVSGAQELRYVDRLPARPLSSVKQPLGRPACQAWQRL